MGKRNDPAKARSALFSGLQVEKRNDDADGKTVVGYAVVFNSVADIGGWFREQFAPGAFTDALANDPDVRALIGHDDDKVLGRTKANTLRISQDDKGLRCEIDLPNTQVARDLVANMERGDVDQMSLLFTPVRQVWDETDPDHPLRTIEAAEVHEVSIVTFPAYEATEAALRSRENDYELHKKQKNYANASRRVRMKANQDMRKRGLRTA